MGTFEIFLFFVATPVLIAVAIGMVLIVVKANKLETFSTKQVTQVEKLESATTSHMIEEAIRHKYNEGRFASIDNKLQALPDVVVENISSPINKLYEKIDLLGYSATLDNLTMLFNRILGENNYGVIGGETIFFGSMFDDIKITYLFHFTPDRKKLIIQTFSHLFESISPEGLTKLLEYNSSTIIGTIGLRTFGDKKLIMIDDTLDLPSSRLNEDSLRESIALLAQIHSDLFAKKEIFDVTFIQILIKDYLQLTLGEQKFNELLESSKGVKGPEEPNN